MPQLAQQPEFDFEHSLPPGREYFTLRFLAGLLQCSQYSIQKLIDEGDLKLSADIAPSSSTKSMQRIARASIIAFLNSRKGGVFIRRTRSARL